MAVLVVACLMAWPAAVHATVGGPDLAEIVGLDSRAQRVYFVLQHVDESGRPGSLFYFDLASTTPARPIPVGWKLGLGSHADSVFEARLATLRRGLVRLEETTLLESFVTVTDPAVWDSVDSDDGRKTRYVVTVRTLADEAGRSPRVVTLDPSRRAVRELRRYRLPGTRRFVAIWSCESLAFEGGYEMQFPVLLGEWRGRPDPIGPEAYAAPE
jgi:hypothetical protein